MNSRPFTTQELLEDVLFYSRKEKELQERLQKLLESLKEDSEEEIEIDLEEDEV